MVRVHEIYVLGHRSEGLTRLRGRRSKFVLFLVNLRYVQYLVKLVNLITRMNYIHCAHKFTLEI
jgi:hypothetical protein